jgi:hypothetical protein
MMSLNYIFLFKIPVMEEIFYINIIILDNIPTKSSGNQIKLLR